MPLKILLADDSMTAQKMGKEILTGAGYEVIAVSNGAAAAKKLAEKPDICVLDIIMPGYTGIEVAEKIRAAAETAKTPVLLTVGKMEHFEQKDVQRVGADGVIVKPFEATDLLTAVQKLAERLSAPKAGAAAASAPSYEKTMIFTPPNIEEFKDDSYNQWKTEAEVHEEGTGEQPASKKSFDMPAEAAAAPAFLTDDTPAETAPAAPLSGTSRDKTVLITPPTFAASAAAAAPAMEITPVPPVEEMITPPAASFDLPPVAPVEEIAPAVVEDAPVATEHAIEFTAQAPVEVDAPIISGFEATAHASVEVAQVQDSALVTGTEGFHSFKTTIGESAPPAQSAPAQDDFEARVAAAMSSFEEPKAEAAVEEAVIDASEELESEPAYEHTQKISIPQEYLEPAPGPVTEAASPATVEQPVVEQIEPVVPAEEQRAVPDGMMDAALVEQMQAAVAGLPVETATTEEPVAEKTQPISPPIEAAPTPVVETSHQDLELAKALAAAVGAEAPPPSASPSEATHIAMTVHKVLERMLPNIVEELKKELEKK